ncbi:intradiol ring-cleavage dioxygenase [Gordonia desulfuricans]|uniref:intradiol ring-cleavage dioxygenase n=1 Tax=Gordonia desulfuricans TaxID=89051 RepID=UPI00073EB385|nr:intradiol ring-cleavage dioxygenase [Gordonia desulfuricans]
MTAQHGDVTANPDSPRSTRRFPSRRSVLAGTGSLSIAGLLAACGVGSSDDDSASSASSSASSGSVAASASVTAADREILDGLLAKSPACPLSKDVTEGPYWFDVDRIRSDIREDRQGVPLELALRVVDLENCTADGDGTPIRDAVVEIWHCDALGIYSGFEATSSQPNGGLGAPGGDGAPPAPPSGAPGGPQPRDGGAPQMPDSGVADSDGSYSEGEPQSKTTDSEKHLRGAQPTDQNGMVYFTSIFPGWYFSRTVHIHVRVHINRKEVLTTQLYFDDELSNKIYSTTAPYNTHTNRDTTNATDHIFDATGLLQASQAGGKVYAAINLGVDT